MNVQLADFRGQNPVKFLLAAKRSNPLVLWCQVPVALAALVRSPMSSILHYAISRMQEILGVAVSVFLNAYMKLQILLNF